MSSNVRGLQVHFIKMEVAENRLDFLSKTKDDNESQCKKVD
jgi:hypothetical protein